MWAEGVRCWFRVLHRVCVMFIETFVSYSWTEQTGMFFVNIDTPRIAFLAWRPRGVLVSLVLWFCAVKKRNVESNHTFQMDRS